MLTVIVGRAVFGSPITVSETWTKIRGRLLPLFGLALLEAAIVTALLGLVAVGIAMLVAIGGGVAAVLLGFPLMLVMIALIVYLYTVVLFAPVLIVLERLPVVDAVTRSFALVRNGFWRVLGIRALTYVVVTVVADAVAVPFTIVGEVMLAGTPSTGIMLLSDRDSRPSGRRSARSSRHRSTPASSCCSTPTAECVLRHSIWYCRAAPPADPYATASTDNLWLTRPV